MKLLNLLISTLCLISASFAAKEYQITYYGCPKECHSQRNPSCDLPTYPLEEGGTKYFCALSTHFPHYKEYCGKRVVVMLTDGSKNMLNVKVVDSCSSCPQYHVDLSQYSFEHLLPLRKGEADCIWAVYDTDGTKLAGPIYNSVSSAASTLGMSKESFIEAFESNARRLVRNNDEVGVFGKSSSSDGYSKKTSSKSKSSSSSYSSRSKSSSRSSKTSTRRTTYYRPTTRKTTNSVYLPPKRSSTYLPPKRSSTYLPPKRSSTYLPAKNAATQLPPKQTPQSIPSKSLNDYSALPAKNVGYDQTSNNVLPPKNIGFGQTNNNVLPAKNLGYDQTSNNGLPPKNIGFGQTNNNVLPAKNLGYDQTTNNVLPPKNIGYDQTTNNNYPVLPAKNIGYDQNSDLSNLPPKRLEMDPAGLTAGFPNGPQENTELDPPGLTAGFPNVPPEVANGINKDKKPETTPILTPPPPKQKEKGVGETGGVDAKVGIACAAIGGTLGAAGLGLFLMKKRSPSTYEGIKRSFPEAFNTVKRSLSRKNTRENDYPNYPQYPNYNQHSYV